MLYYVTRRENQWRVNVNRALYGPYKTRSEAIERAVQAAQRDGVSGRSGMVLVQDEDGEFRATWPARLATDDGFIVSERLSGIATGA
jgi:hypothetical protein